MLSAKYSPGDDGREFDSLPSYFLLAGVFCQGRAKCNASISPALRLNFVMNAARYSKTNGGAWYSMFTQTHPPSGCLPNVALNERVVGLSPKMIFAASVSLM